MPGPGGTGGDGELRFENKTRLLLEERTGHCLVSMDNEGLELLFQTENHALSKAPDIRDGCSSYIDVRRMPHHSGVKSKLGWYSIFLDLRIIWIHYSILKPVSILFTLKF